MHPIIIMQALHQAPTIGLFRSTSAKDVMDFHRRATPRTVLVTVSTRFEPPTDTKGSCYRAQDMSSSSISFTAANYALNCVENHLNAAMAVLTDYRHNEFVLKHYDSNKDDDGFVFTFELEEHKAK